jgi:hypothetical protein
MTAQRRPATSAAPRPTARVSPTQRRIREDREDREALDRAADALQAGTLETISNADLKAQLGLD